MPHSRPAYEDLITLKLEPWLRPSSVFFKASLFPSVLMIIRPVLLPTHADNFSLQAAPHPGCWKYPRLEQHLCSIDSEIQSRRLPRVPGTILRPLSDTDAGGSEEVWRKINQQTQIKEYTRNVWIHAQLCLIPLHAPTDDRLKRSYLEWMYCTNHLFFSITPHVQKQTGQINSQYKR